MNNAYAPHWTSRVRIHYNVQGKNHTMTFRFPGPISGSGLTDALTTINDFLNAMESALWSDWTVNAVTAADIDSTIFLPIVNPITAVGTVDPVDREPENKAYMLTFVARTAGGNPWKFSLFGVSSTALEVTGSRDYRIRAGESSVVDGAIDLLQVSGGALIGNDAEPLFWYDYANTGEYDPTKKDVRRGA